MKLLHTTLLNPRNDLVFRLLLNDAEIVKGFLQSVLSSADARRLNNLAVFEDSPITRELVENKGSRLDIKATSSDGLKINIEMQRTNQYNMEKRTFFYLSRLYTENVVKGADYKKLPKLITINILDFSYLYLNEIHNYFHLWDSRHKKISLFEVMEIHFILLKIWGEQASKDLHIPLHRWLTFLDIDQPEARRKEAAAMETAIAKAQERLEYLSSDKETRALSQIREDAIRDLNNMLQGAKDEGKEEGRKEVARQMLLEGEEIEKITRYTGLSLEDIAKLKDKDYEQEE